MKGPITVLGLISGSSLDGLDVALCTFDISQPGDQDWKCHYTKTYEFTAPLFEGLTSATSLSAKDLMQLEHQFSLFCADVINQIQQEQDRKIDYICSHGHTVYHFPQDGWTLQIGKGATMAELTGIPCITDVRANDIALGGQGAPVAPIVEQWLIPGLDYYFNLGGITNISSHSKDESGVDHILSFDSGPCNQVLNTFSQELGMAYDNRGMEAEKGIVHEDLLQAWLAVDYLSAPIPKSLDNTWVKEYFTPMADKYNLSVHDRLATMVEFIAIQSAKDIGILKGDNRGKQRAYFTGGGAHNDFLMQRLNRHLGEHNVFTMKPDDRMINFKEAILLSLMGYLRVKQIPNTIQSVTGASKATLGGAIYRPASL